MIVSNLPYARETLGVYEKVNFFDHLKLVELADRMTEVINVSVVLDSFFRLDKPELYTNNLTQKIDNLLNNESS